MNEDGSSSDYQSMKKGMKEAFSGLKSFSLTKVKEDFLFISNAFVLFTWTGTVNVELKTGQRFRNDIHTASLLYSKIDNKWKNMYEHTSESLVEPDAEK